MTDEALAKQIGTQMAVLHRVTRKLCELQTEAAVRLEMAGKIPSVEAVIEPKED